MTKEKIGKCHDCPAPQTEVDMLSRHILELQADKGRLTDKVRDLEAEVKEWKDKADLWCKTANLKDHNIMINKELEKENADLKEEINKIAFARGNLEEENAELKAFINAPLIKGRRTTRKEFYQTIWDLSGQLTKATKIIKKLYAVYYDPCVTESDLKYRDELFAEIKQFLSEVEK